MHLGQVWIIYPYRTNEKGERGVTELLYDLGPKARDTIAIYSDISQDGKFAYCKFTIDWLVSYITDAEAAVTLTTANHIAALDISDLKNVKRLDDPNKDQGIVGPHYVKISPDKKNLLVTDYFVQGGDISIINTPADFKAQWIDIQKDGSLKFNRFIDFNGAEVYRPRGGAKPHSAVIFDLADPKHPYYY